LSPDLSSRRAALRATLAAATLAATLCAPDAWAEQRGAAASQRQGTIAVPLPPPPTGTQLERRPLPPPAATTRTERRDATLSAGIGPWVGFGTGQAVALHVDYGFQRTPPGWSRFDLEIRLAVMVTHPSYDTSLTQAVISPTTFAPTQIDVGVKRTRAWVVEAVPFARLRYAVAPKLTLLADAGAGLAQSIERIESDQTYAGRTVKTQNVTGLVVRVGGGASLAVGERLRVVFLPVALSLQLGPGYGAYLPSVSLAYPL
jgi:hypothetical protein